MNKSYTPKLYNYSIQKNHFPHYRKKRDKIKELGLLCVIQISFFFCSLTSHIFFSQVDFFFTATSYAVYLIILCSIEIIIKKNSREKYEKKTKKYNLIHFIQEIIFYISSIHFNHTLLYSYCYGAPRLLLTLFIVIAAYIDSTSSLWQNRKKI